MNPWEWAAIGFIVWFGLCCLVLAFMHGAEVLRHRSQGRQR